jgi:hypothetical protein
MKVWRFTFSHDAFYQLPDEERIFWLQLAQIRNDLRAIDAICIPLLNVVSARRETKKYSEAEQWIALHQLTFAIRQLCGTLEEAHKVISKKWHGTSLNKRLSPVLNQKAKDALKAFNKYFSSQNLVTTIRQKFAHHFDSEILKGRLCSCPPGELHEFIAGQTYGNVFYKFAEDLRYHAIVRVTGETDLQNAVRRLYDEPRHAVMHPFEDFADDVLFKIAQGLDMKMEEVSVDSPIDPKMLQPFLLFPELEPGSVGDMINNVS